MIYLLGLPTASVYVINYEGFQFSNIWYGDDFSLQVSTSGAERVLIHEPYDLQPRKSEIKYKHFLFPVAFLSSKSPGPFMEALLLSFPESWKSSVISASSQRTAIKFALFQNILTYQGLQ